jgi:hypothetical protein
MSESKVTVQRLHSLERSRFLVLLVGLVAMIGFLPILAEDRHASVALDAALIFVLIACIWSMGQRKRVIAIGCALLVPAAVAAWITDDSFGPQLDIIGLLCALTFLAITALALLVNIVRQRDVVSDTILGGICVYLLFAVMWALLYEVMERLHPGSFGPWPTPTGALSLKRLVTPDLIYYSVFVLSTIGPQDVHPISGAARAWTGIEAMVGQLYLAVLIARLVSRQVVRGDA